MRGTWISRLRLGATKLLRDQGGNAMMLTAAAIVPIVGIVGSGIDIGRAYMAQLRLQQACDAGVLAGRRAMAGGTYTDAAEEEANKMFAFNYPTGTYGSSGITFDSVPDGTADVDGTASAFLPTTIMRIFGNDGFDLTASCTAKLEISNADIMLVLDVTGSMDSVNSGDSVSRIVALRAAAIDFFDTLTTAELGDGRLRFGVVPYSGTVNVGQILVDEDPSWIADTAWTPTRTPTFVDAWGTGSSVNGTPTNDNYSYGDWGSWGSFSSTQANCKTPPQSAGTNPSTSGNPTTVQNSQYVDANGNRITVTTIRQNYTHKEYAYRWNTTPNPDRCERRERTVTYRQNTPSTLTQPPIKQFSFFTYHNRELDVASGKTGGTLTFKTGTRGVDVSTTWDGCIIERDTTPFNSTTTAPSNAYDMDINLVPHNDATRWRMFLPDFAYSRNSQASTTSTSTSHVDSFEDKALAGDQGACPVPAMRLTTMTAADRGTFTSYIGGLRAHGFTYHDTGMAWGARLISPTGILAADNATAPNNRPIARHILFMTDGEMNPPVTNFSHQSLEQATGRIGASNLTDATNRHNNRFLQLCERAKGQNITVWVVSFGVNLNNQLRNCATPGKAYQASNAAQLNENFQAIARQISKLRLSQ